MSDATTTIGSTTVLRAVLLIHIQLVRRLIKNGVLSQQDAIADVNRLQTEAANLHASVPELSATLTHATMILAEMLGDRPTAPPS